MCSSQGQGVQGKEWLTKCVCVCAHVCMGGKQCASRIIYAEGLCVALGVHIIYAGCVSMSG